jgi:AraC-like DNA-binding protein
MIAQRLHISRSYVQKLYKKIFNISYMNDLIHARIRKAQKLLLESNLTIGEIASGCGYQSTTHFVRQFKDKTGVTPSEYRNGHNEPKNES